MPVIEILYKKRPTLKTNFNTFSQICPKIEYDPIQGILVSILRFQGALSEANGRETLLKGKAQ